MSNIAEFTSRAGFDGAPGLELVHRDEFDLSLDSDPHLYAQRTGRNDLERHFIEQSESLPGVAGGEIDPSVLILRTCPLCASPQSDILFVKYRFPIRRCNSCGFIYASPVLDHKQIPANAMDLGDLSSRHLSLVTQDFYRACARKRFEFELQQVILRSERALTSYLEIGCSVGTGLEVAREYGCDALGIEPNEEAASIARSEGNRVISGLFTPAMVDGRTFDIVASMDVLEHVDDPVGFLRSQRDVVSDDGFVLVQIPNAGALISLVEGAANQVFNGLIHLNYFDCVTLDKAGREAGLESVATFTILSELGKLRTYSQECIATALKQHRPDLTLPLHLHQDWINANGLGYKVIGIYRKC